MEGKDTDSGEKDDVVVGETPLEPMNYFFCVHMNIPF